MPDPLDRLEILSNLPVRPRQEFVDGLAGRLRFELAPILSLFRSEQENAMVSASIVHAVRSIAAALPGVEEGQKPGRSLPHWATSGGGFTGFRNDGSLIIWVETEAAKQAMIDAEPDAFFTTDHYDGYPIVLVRPEVVTSSRLRDLIVESWRQKASRSLVRAWDEAQP